MTRRRALVAAAAVLAVVVGVALAWLLARPEPSAWADGLSITAVSLLFGLGMLGLVDAEPSPDAVAVVAAVWGATSLVAAWLQVAQRVGVSAFEVGVGDFTTGVESGLPIVVCVLGSLSVLAWAWWTSRGSTQINAYVVAAIAAVGILVTSVTGHAGQSSWVPLVVGAHALAAAWWIGSLGALVLTVRGRGGWARSLPAFSERALGVVAVLTVTGVVAAVARIGVGSQWWDTGYGRILVAKIVLLAAAAALARWHRTAWLAKARRHGVDEATSIRNAGIEVALLSVVLGLAAALATTG
ncbi:CopD family protein [Gordonia sp. HY002]|uniref:CopD family protein n=1 Tax=Gordonia zhenghanii TaxID=2911516 RepID=UPI001EF06465|nr:CopD family protein [Gordonia zhenghanii]MCF8568889.1 CopD family protein [Gordonia zhenghanii]MCF8607968.1 CopD family protein [Gordonia zhenghanii]